MRARFTPGRPVILRGLVEGPDGGEWVRLLLDTGAVFTSIRPGVLKDIGVKPSEDEGVQITTASRIENIPIAVLPRLFVSDLERRELRVLSHPLPPTAEIDGLLAMDFMIGLHLSLRMRQGILTLEEDRDPN